MTPSPEIVYAFWKLEQYAPAIREGLEAVYWLAVCWLGCWVVVRVIEAWFKNRRG